MALPRPEAGLVLSYNYLWREDALGGREDSGKGRPSVIVLVARRASGKDIVTVCPSRIALRGARAKRWRSRSG